MKVATGTCMIDLVSLSVGENLTCFFLMGVVQTLSPELLETGVVELALLFQ